eukprot:TRINITY_DN18655_c0_g1_i2.p1 TRINITY_DN18655_c0_g1~~TRINITY_DN18655_c0_g1_i2.p1  ORF type:complete len:359 (-),score=36.84 TRINITY_DN18655_c0_g1_i2:73-1149(-)
MMLPLAALSYIASGTAATVAAVNEFQLLPNATCLENPPNDVWCYPDRSNIFYDRLLEAVLQKLHLPSVAGGLDASEQTVLHQALLERCIGTEPFPALHRTAVHNYHVCTKRIRLLEHGYPFMVFLPRDDQDKIGECNVPAWLIQFATGQPGGIAVDIGAGDSGDCSFPLLSEGHIVHMFERGYAPEPGRPLLESERGFVQMTIDANPGWSDRAVLHGPVEHPTYIEQTFQDSERIHLIKIDVDDAASYKQVLLSLKPILGKTDIVHMELITAEIGRKGKRTILSWFVEAGFWMYAIEDVETWPGHAHGSLGSCSLDDGFARLPLKDHRSAVRRGAEDYVYGEHSPERMRMVPILMYSL